MPQWRLEILRTNRNVAVELSVSSRSKIHQQRCFASSLRSADGQTRHHTHLPQSSRAIPLRTLFTTSRASQAQEASAKPTTARNPAPVDAPVQNLNSGLSDQPLDLNESDTPQIDWTKSFHGLSIERFDKEAADVLLAPLDEDDVEIKPDGILYLPEIKYRRIMNRAFGPGAWGLAPRGESIVTSKAVTREYALVVHGRYGAPSKTVDIPEILWLNHHRLVSIARGEMDYFSPEGIPTAAEGCKSNALMRCCKDLGIASELWDPRWIRKFRRSTLEKSLWSMQ